VQLKKSLQCAPDIVDAVKKIDNDHSDALIEDIDLCTGLVDRLQEGISSDPPLSVKEGGIINDGFHETLDEYRHASKNGKDWIASLQQKEREETGIKSLKV